VVLYIFWEYLHYMIWHGLSIFPFVGKTVVTIPNLVPAHIVSDFVYVYSASDVNFVGKYLFTTYYFFVKFCIIFSRLWQNGDCVY